MAYIDTLSEKITAKRDEMTSKLARANSEGESDGESSITALERGQLLDDCEALHAEIVPLEEEYAKLGRALAAEEEQRSFDQTAPMRREQGRRANSGELTWERMAENGGDDGHGVGYHPSIPQGMSLARALMESEPFKVSPKMMGNDVILPGVLDRAIGPAVNAAAALERADVNYGAETVTSPAGFRTEIPFTGEVVSRPAYTPSILNIVPRVSVDRLSLTWLLQTVRTDTAQGQGTSARITTQVDEGAAANEANLEWTPQRVNLKRVRTYIPVTEDALSSEMLLQTLIENDLVDLIRQAASRAIVQDNGGGTNISGFASTRAGQQNTDYATSSGVFTGDVMETAITSSILRVKKFGATMPSHIVINPEVFDPMLNLQRDGWYLFSPVADPATLRYRGIPIVESFNDFVNYADGTVSAIVGDFSRYSRMFTMGDVSIASTMSHGTRFVQFEVVFRAGHWCEFVVTRETAFCTISRSD